MTVPILLIALIPVLLLGMLFVELLLSEAPRKGKRPDAKGKPRPPRRLVKVITPSGEVLTGSPERIVALLARQGFIGAPTEVETQTAWQLLDAWRAVGRIQLQIEWVG